MPTIYDVEGDKIRYEVLNSHRQLWKFSSSNAWNNQNTPEFPEWINFNYVNFLQVEIDHNLIKSKHFFDFGKLGE